MRPQHFFIFLLFCNGLYAQNKLSYSPSYLPVFMDKSGDTLKKALLGGLNQPQFQAMDLNNDGKKDLVVHDRSGGQILPFLNLGNGDITTFKYAPEFVSVFPKMGDVWFMLVDYDKDGKEDLWTKLQNKTVLYRNITGSGDKKAKFMLTSEALMAYNFMSPPLDSSVIAADYFNIPAIADVDGDGDIDIFSYQANEGNLLLYRNMTADFKLPLHPPIFDIADFCWGNFRDTSYDGVKLASCPYKYYRKHSGGSSLLWFDNDMDGDLDVLMGNAGGTNLIYLNNGKSDFKTLYDSISSYDGHWPSKSVSVSQNSFPAAFMLDADGDSLPDILVAPNQVDQTYPREETKQVMFYKNTGTKQKPDFKFERKNYFTDEFLDHGSYSDPILWDIDNDADLDLLLSSNGDNAITGNFNYRIILYRNIGTKNKPVFKLEDEDLWGLSKDSIQYLSLAIGDLSGDGLPDLVAGNYFGSLYFYKNIGNNSSWAFTTPVRNYGGVRVGERSTPQIVDLDKDGLPDLIVGELEGNINYFRNIGSSGNPKFTLMDDTLGNFVINEITGFDNSGNPRYYYIGNASAEVLDLDNDGKYELVCGGEEGKVRVFRFDNYNQPNFKEDTMVMFDSAFMRYTTTDFGAQSKPAAGDLDGDGVKDLIIGNNRGGIHFLKGTVAANSIRNIANITKPVIYPNPSFGKDIQIKNMPKELVAIGIYDITGNLIQHHLSNPGNTDFTLKTQGLADGVYFINIKGKETMFNYRVIINYHN